MKTTSPSPTIQQALIGAIDRLVRSKPFDEISVSELTKVAGVSRMTFYRHYHTVRDVLSTQVGCLLEEFTSGIHYTGDNYGYIIQTIYFFHHHRQFIKLLLAANRQDLLLRQVTVVMRELTTYNPYLVNFSKREIDYFVEYHTTGLMKVIIDWIQNGEPDTAENLANFLNQNIKKVPSP